MVLKTPFLLAVLALATAAAAQSGSGQTPDSNPDMAPMTRDGMTTGEVKADDHSMRQVDGKWMVGDREATKAEAKSHRQMMRMKKGAMHKPM